MFFTKQKSGEVILIVDIGTSSVGAALVAKDTLPKVLFSTRSQISPQSNPDIQRSFVVIKQTLELVLKSVVAEGKLFDKLHLFFSSPWCVSKTSVLKVEHEKPILVTRGVIDKLTKEAEEKFLTESVASGEIVEHSITRTKLNGYEVADPFNKKAKDIEIALFSSVVSAELFAAVREVIHKNFHIKHEEVSSFLLAAFNAISGIMPKERDFMIVDVRSEVTEISLIFDGALTKNIFFPLGKNGLIKAVSDNSNQSLSAALSLISLALQGDSDSDSKINVARFSETFKKDWVAFYTKSTQEILAGSVVPQTIFLVADQDVEKFFETTLNETKKDADIHPLKHLNIKDYLETSSMLLDQFLALESIFVTMI